MAGAKFKPSYKTVPSVTKSVNALQDAAAGIDIWTPATGKRFVVMGFSLQAFVSVVLQNAAAGDRLIIYDEVASAPIACLGVIQDGLPVAGSILTSSMNTGVGAFAAAVTEMGASLPPITVNGMWYRSTAVNQDVKVALVTGATTVVDVGTGEIRVVGTIWGHEEA